MEGEGSQLHFTVPRLEVSENQIVNERVSVSVPSSKLNRLEQIMSGSREKLPSSTIGFDSTDGFDNHHHRDIKTDGKKSTTFEHFGTSEDTKMTGGKNQIKAAQTAHRGPVSTESTLILSNESGSSPPLKRKTPVNSPGKDVMKDEDETPAPGSGKANKKRFKSGGSTIPRKLSDKLAERGRSTARSTNVRRTSGATASATAAKNQTAKVSPAKTASATSRQVNSSVKNSPVQVQKATPVVPVASANAENSKVSSILAYFPKQGDVATPTGASSAQMVLREEALKSRENELEKRLRAIEEREAQVIERERKSQHANKDRLNESEHTLRGVVAEYEQYKANVNDILVDLLRKVSMRSRRENEEKLMREGYNIGRVVARREGHMVTDCWEDGEMLKECRRNIERLTQERDEVTALKKQLAAKKRSKGRKEAAAAAKSESDGEFKRPAALVPDNAATYEEQNEIYTMRLQLLKKELADLKQEEDNFEQKKKQLIKFQKLMEDESNSRFNQHPALNNGRYILLEMLGKGGFSEVYKAFDLLKLRYVACKIHQLNPNWSNERKMNYTKHATREYNIHKDLHHPRIVQLFDVFAIDLNSFCTVLDFCDGCDLDMYLKTKQTLSEKEALCIVRQVFSGLKYLNTNKQKIIHYDLKPGNILFHNGEVKITDFGLSKIVGPESMEGGIELTSQGAGTYWYLPPECFQLDQRPLISSKVDVWSVGVILYQILYGMKPFGNGQTPEKLLSSQTIRNARGDEVTFPAKPNVSSKCKDFIRKCLTHRAADRPNVLEVFDLPFLKM